MIGRINGTLLQKNPPSILVDCHGVGYEMEVSMNTFYILPDTGGHVTLFTHLAVREDAHTLFGFASQEERSLFRQLVRISGVGARTALALLSGMSVADFVRTVTLADAASLCRIPGIGKKTAERLLLELKDKLGAGDVVGGGAPSQPGVSADVLNALVALGYSAKEAQAAMKQLSPQASVSDGIRQALKILSRNG
jgi:Holliday junction DNA helicase RuvA